MSFGALSKRLLCFFFLLSVWVPAATADQTIIPHLESPACHYVAVAVDGNTTGTIATITDGNTTGTIATITVTVTNNGNAAISWHDIHEICMPLAAENATQCPILPGDMATYKFVVDVTWGDDAGPSSRQAIHGPERAAANVVHMPRSDDAGPSHAYEGGSGVRMGRPSIEAVAMAGGTVDWSDDDGMTPEHLLVESLPPSRFDDILEGMDPNNGPDTYARIRRWAKAVSHDTLKKLNDDPR